MAAGTIDTATAPASHIELDIDAAMQLDWFC
jgi:hypothetical protein